MHKRLNRAVAKVQEMRLNQMLLSSNQLSEELSQRNERNSASI